MDKKEIGRKLKELRGEKTIQEVADYCGVTKAAISNYEQGIRIPKDTTKVKLARCYGTTIEAIFFTS